MGCLDGRPAQSPLGASDWLCEPGRVPQPSHHHHGHRASLSRGRDDRWHEILAHDKVQAMHRMGSPSAIGVRVRALRMQRGLSQDALARVFAFRDRQTVSAIETGVRALTAAELVIAVERLGVSLDFFTDPFRLDGDARFSWRQSGVPIDQLQAYEQTAGRWIGAYRALATEAGWRAPLMRRALGLTRASRFEDATAAGERFAEELRLGPVPATRLASAMEAELGILVLMVNAQAGISGAACRLPELDAVLIARSEVLGRRHFDLAHELFHILTWDAMPPEYVEAASDVGGNRVEQLANNFAAAVLMPSSALHAFEDCPRLDADELTARLNTVANELKVTSSALRWRLAALGCLTRARARAIPETALRNNGRESAPNEQPPLFSKPFAQVVADALERGSISVRRAASLCGLAIEELEDVFAAHGVEHAIEL